MMTTTRRDEPAPPIARHLADARKNLEEAADNLRALEASVRALRVRGTRRDLRAVGDEGPTTELNALVERLLEVKPMTSAELVEATGAREKRISGAIVAIQRDPSKVRRLENRGTRSRALWFMRAR